MKIALGTTSKSKIEFLEEVLKELRLGAELIVVDVLSGVSDQPLSTEETKAGSINRAKGALKEAKMADFSMGIEVGYHPTESGDYEMFCWVTIVDNEGREVSAQSHKLLLPKFHQDILKANKYLGEYVREYLAKASNAMETHVGEIITYRKPFIQTAVKSAIISYLVR